MKGNSMLSFYSFYYFYWLKNIIISGPVIGNFFFYDLFEILDDVDGLPLSILN